MEPQRGRSGEGKGVVGTMVFRSLCIPGVNTTVVLRSITSTVLFGGKVYFSQPVYPVYVCASSRMVRGVRVLSPQLRITW